MNNHIIRIFQSDGRSTKVKFRQIKILFKAADEDNNGVISRNEWIQLVHKMYR